MNVLGIEVREVNGIIIPFTSLTLRSNVEVGEVSGTYQGLVVCILRRIPDSLTERSCQVLDTMRSQISIYGTAENRL